jgi:hypothetical protein
MAVEGPSVGKATPIDLIQEVKSGQESEVVASKAVEARNEIHSEAEVWAARKRRSQAVVLPLRTVDADRAAKLSNCGSWMAIRHWVKQHRTSMYAANFCQMPRLCQSCSHVRGMKLAMAYAEKAAHLLAENPDLRPWLVTYTVRTGPDLAERFDHLQRSISSMWQRVKDSKKQGRKVSKFAAIQGQVISTEIKRSKVGEHLWQPHAHALALVDHREWRPVQVDGLELVLDYVPHQQICDEWQEITGDSYICNAKPLSSGLDLGAGAEINRCALLRDLFEVFKYLTKPGELSPQDVIDVWRLLCGRRAVRAFGRLHGVQVPEGYEGESLGGDAWEVWHHWERRQYLPRYVRFVAGDVPADAGGQVQ